MSVSARKKAERIKRMKEEARMRQYMRERQEQQYKKVDRTFKEYTQPDIVRRDEGVEYKSLNSGEYNTFRNADKVYTGTLVKGIGTMHKSNAVPIISQEEAIDIATMRRN